MLESLTHVLRRFRHGAFAGLPPGVVAAIRAVSLFALDVGTLFRGRPVRVAGEFPMRVEWNRMAVDFTTHELAFTRAFGRALDRPQVVFDIGASLGEWSVLAATRVGADRVHVFEPNPPAWRAIRAIFFRNRLARPAGLFPGFASNTDNCPDTVLAAVMGRDWPPADAGRIYFESLAEPKALPMARVDTYCARTGVNPDVIKIDVEGAEGEVLRGMTATIAACAPTVFLSIHPWAVGAFGDTRDGLLDWMRARGYRCELLGEDHEEHWICSHPSRHAVGRS